MVREGFLEEPSDLRITSEGSHWAKGREKGVPGRWHSISKDLVSARCRGSCDRGEAGGVSRIQDLQLEKLRLCPDSIGEPIVLVDSVQGRTRSGLGFRQILLAVMRRVDQR